MRLVTQTQADRDWISALPAPEPDDGFDYLGVVITKPWGCEWEIFASDVLSLWSLKLNPDSETSLHAHPGKLTALMLIEGDLTVSTLHERYGLEIGELIVIDRGAFHRSSTVSGALLIEAEVPNNKRDLVRLDDRYGRQGQGYERH